MKISVIEAGSILIIVMAMFHAGERGRSPLSAGAPTFEIAPIQRSTTLPSDVTAAVELARVQAAQDVPSTRQDIPLDQR